MPKLVIYRFVTWQVSMGTNFICCTTVTKGWIWHILLLHVKKAGSDWAFNPHNSKNTKLI